MAFELPPLPYAYDALEPYIDTQTMQLHHDKHHAAYVNNLNAALQSSAHQLIIIDNCHHIRLPLTGHMDKIATGLKRRNHTLVCRQ